MNDIPVLKDRQNCTIVTLYDKLPLPESHKKQENRILRHLDLKPSAERRHWQGDDGIHST